MSRRYGRAAIVWTDTSDTTTQRVFLLDQPLIEAQAAHSLTSYYAESLDRTVNQTVTVGSGAYELVGKVRYASNQGGLMDVIRAGSNGTTLTYIPDTMDPAVSESVTLLAPRSPADLELDAQRGQAFGEAQITLRFRRTDQKSMARRTGGSDVLFAYHAGDSLADATFSRATTSTSPATYPGIASTSDFGYGTLTTAKTNKARLAWFSSLSSVGSRSIPALLLEPTRTNVVARSYQFNTTAGSTAVRWNKSNLTVTTGQTGPDGSSKASLVIDTSTAEATLNCFPVLTKSTYAVLSWFAKQGTTAKTSRFVLRSIGGTTHIGVTFGWSSGTPTVSYDAGTGAAVPQRWRNGYYRFAARTSGSLTSAAYRVQLTPASTGAATQGDVYLFGVQVEQ